MAFTRSGVRLPSGPPSFAYLNKTDTLQCARFRCPWSAFLDSAPMAMTPDSDWSHGPALPKYV
jgi:hypothetical protein